MRINHCGFLLFTILIAPPLTAIEKNIVLDYSFAKKHKVKLKKEIHLKVPYSDMASIQFPPESGGAYIKVNYETDKKKFIENLQLTSLTIPMVRLKSRLRVIKNLVKKKILPSLKKNFKDAKILSIQKLKINKSPATIIDIKYTNPEIGIMYARIAGILSARSRHGVLLICYLNPKFSEVQTDEDLTKENKGAISKIILSIKLKKLTKKKKKKKKK